MYNCGPQLGRHRPRNLIFIRAGGWGGELDRWGGWGVGAWIGGRGGGLDRGSYYSHGSHLLSAPAAPSLLEKRDRLQRFCDLGEDFYQSIALIFLNINDLKMPSFSDQTSKGKLDFTQLKIVVLNHNEA